jgi:hypothetical protein
LFFNSLKIKFQIKSKYIENTDLDYFNISYKVKNLTKNDLLNLKFYIYLYQLNEENIVFNHFLHSDIYYEGALSHEIQQMNSKSEIKFNIKLFPNEGEDIFTTCLLMDNENRILYISPNSICLNTDI